MRHHIVSVSIFIIRFVLGIRYQCFQSIVIEFVTLQKLNFSHKTKTGEK